MRSVHSKQEQSALYTIFSHFTALIAHKANTFYPITPFCPITSILPKERKKAAQPNGYTALIHQLFCSEWQ